MIEDDESKNMSKRTELGDREPMEIMAAVGGGTRSGMLTTTVVRVGDEEGRRGRKTAELNRNQTPDRGRA